ncbi:proliferating cellular nuclear antigen 1 (PCNA) [Vairimorpha necatrix]|uniref:DNA sliding clamp PCNA n=1 Tax=Vairimorpha necatrix TaxID=6039 RepID=A0AAX4JC18_9MICR
MFELEISHPQVQKGRDKNNNVITKKITKKNHDTDENGNNLQDSDGNEETDNNLTSTDQTKAAVKIENQVVFPGGKIGLLRKTLESISEVVDHVEIKARAEGLEMQVMDSLHVVFVDIFLSKNLFDKYRCDRDITLGVKVKSLITILKDLSFPADSSLHLSCNDDPENLSICYKSSQYTLNWELSLYSFDNEVFEMPAFDFQAEVTMYAQQFMVLPKLIGIFGEFITIEARKNMITFKQKGDTTAAAMTLEEGDDKEVEINVLSEIKKEMAMKYIVIIGKVAGLCSKIKLHLGEETPVFFDFNLFDLGHMRFYIAPKTETDN